MPGFDLFRHTCVGAAGANNTFTRVPFRQSLHDVFMVGFSVLISAPVGLMPNIVVPNPLLSISAVSWNGFLLLIVRILRYRY